MLPCVIDKQTYIHYVDGKMGNIIDHTEEITSESIVGVHYYNISIPCAHFRKSTAIYRFSLLC